MNARQDALLEQTEKHKRQKERVCTMLGFMMVLVTIMFGLTLVQP
ncbi:hypothetical protein [Acetobacter pomorum]|nr:hypothetical protein [Acetobacter pomorum]